jgi:thioredoxin 1
MKVLTSEELKQKIDSGEKFIVDMYADWCGPCLVLGPIVERVSQKLEEEGHEVKVYKFNIESDKDLAVQLGVRSIPTIKVFDGGKVVDNRVGILQEQQLIDLANSIL